MSGEILARTFRWQKADLDCVLAAVAASGTPLDASGSPSGRERLDPALAAAKGCRPARAIAAWATSAVPPRPGCRQLVRVRRETSRKQSVDRLPKSVPIERPKVVPAEDSFKTGSAAHQSVAAASTKRFPLPRLQSPKFLSAAVLMALVSIGRFRSFQRRRCGRPSARQPPRA